MNFCPNTRDNWTRDKTDERFTYVCLMFFLGLVIFFRDVSEQNCVPLPQTDIFFIKININFYRMKERKRINGWDGLEGQTTRKKESDQ